MMKKDFQAIADVISNLPLNEHGVLDISHYQIAAAFVKMLRGTNPRFDSSRFVKACMPKAHVDWTI